MQDKQRCRLLSYRPYSRSWEGPAGWDAIRQAPRGEQEQRASPPVSPPSCLRFSSRFRCPPSAPRMRTPEAWARRMQWAAIQTLPNPLRMITRGTRTPCPVTMTEVRLVPAIAACRHPHVASAFLCLPRNLPLPPRAALWPPCGFRPPCRGIRRPCPALPDSPWPP